MVTELDWDSATSWAQRIRASRPDFTVSVGHGTRRRCYIIVGGVIWDASRRISLQTADEADSFYRDQCATPDELDDEPAEYADQRAADALRILSARNEGGPEHRGF